MSAKLIELLGLFTDMAGTLMVAYAALRVHHRFRHEHKVDDEVFSAMTFELKWGIVGIVLVIIGFILQVIARIILI